MRAVEWIIRAAPPSRWHPDGQKEQRVVVMLDKHEEAWYRDQARRLFALGPGPERTALLNEIALVMDAKALLDARMLTEAET